VTARVSDAFSWRPLERCGPVVGAVDALVGGGPPVLCDCVGGLFDDLAEGCFLVGVVVFVVEVGEVCPDLLFGGDDVCVYVDYLTRSRRYSYSPKSIFHGCLEREDQISKACLRCSKKSSRLQLFTFMKCSITFS